MILLIMVMHVVVVVVGQLVKLDVEEEGDVDEVVEKEHNQNRYGKYAMRFLI